MDEPSSKADVPRAEAENPDDVAIDRASEASPDEATDGATRRRRGLSRRKKLLFSLIATVLALGLFEVSLMVVGVKPIVDKDDPFLGFSSQSPLFVPDTNPETLVTDTSKLSWFNKQSFPAKKSAGTYRVFCMGGSTTYGRPYDDTTSFPGWLRELMAEADSSRPWEVINAGGVSYASYRVALLMKELSRFEPDLFIVYAGHNEFLEHRTYGSIIKTPTVIRNLSMRLRRTRTYSLVHRLFKPGKKSAAKKYMLPSEVNAMLDHTVGPQSYVRDDAFREQVISHYRDSLQRMVKIARDCGAEIIFVQPASNLRDCAPFKSEPSQAVGKALLAKRLEVLESVLKSATEALEADQATRALSTADAALELDDRYAKAHYLRGRVLWKLKRYDDAKEAFIRALDEDICPLRALPRIQQVLTEVCEAADVRLVDFASAVTSRAEHGISGEDLFLDHVHPTIAGNRLIARLLLDELVEMAVVKLSSDWNEQAIKSVVDRVESRLDRNAHAVALRKLSQVLSWAGKLDEGDRLALRALESLPEDAETLYLAGNAEARRGNDDKAIVHYRSAIEADDENWLAHFNLGNVYVNGKQFQKAADCYRNSVRINPRFVGGHHNLGRAYMDLGDYEQAVKCFEEMLRLRPGEPRALKNLKFIADMKYRKRNSGRGN